MVMSVSSRKQCCACVSAVCLATAELPAYSVTSVGGVLWVMAAMKIVTKLLQCVHDLLINVFCISTRLCLFIIYDALTDSKAWQHCELCHSDHSSYLSTVLCHPRHASFQFFFTVSVSVCPSVTRSYRVNTNDRRIVHFSPSGTGSGSPQTSFLIPTFVPYVLLPGEPLARASNETAVGKTEIFRPIS